MSDKFEEILDETADQLSESAVGILQRDRIGVYIVPSRDEVVHQLVVVFPYEFGAELAGSGVRLPAVSFSLRHEVGAWWTFSLPDLPQFRDEYERIRDQIRHGRTGRAQEQEPDMDDIQELIDILVIVERAIEFIETSESSESSEQDRHYRRVSALCDDPMTIIKNVEKAIKSGEQHSQPANPPRQSVAFCGSRDGRKP